MKYIIEIALFLIVLYATRRAKEQMEKAVATKKYDFGIYYKINPLTGDKAVHMARFQLTIIKIAPWAMASLILIYNLLEWLK